MDQSRAPILEAIEEHRRRNRYGFTPPGHRQGRGVDPRVLDVLGVDPFRSDLLATAGLDDRMASGGFVQSAQELMADAVGAEQAFFSTCGSSLSVKAAILAVTRGTGEILIGRDAHKSVAAGLVLSGLQPRWIRPSWDPDLHLAHPPTPEAVEEMWQRYPDASAALITSPTPYGTSADLAAIVEVCHKRGRPLIVDEAWGAHLPFHDELPTWAMDAGADVCVVSVHKMGTGFEQGSVYHLQGDLVDPIRLKECADVLATTSSNVLLYAAMDGWRRQMVEHGRDLLGEALTRVRSVRSSVNDLRGLRVMDDEFVGAGKSKELDPLHIVIDVSELGISGYQAADWMRGERSIDMGLSDHRRIEATFSIADDDATATRLLDSLATLVEAASSMPAAKPMHLPSPSELELDTVMLPRDAFFGPVEVVPVTDAVGRIAAEQITPYPPGIPAVLPGERINQGVLDYLTTGLEAGMVLPDPADPSLKTVRVARE
jgi:arginine decarboxylase